MSGVRIEAPLLDFIPLYNEFIDNYLKDARGDFVKVYLVCLRFGYLGVDVSMQKISSLLNLLESDVVRALEYWEDVGLMKTSPQGLIEILSFEKDRDLTKAGFVDKNIKDMLQSIQGIVARPLSPKESYTYISWIDDYKFSPEAVVLLVEYCVVRKKTNIRYMEKIALAWHDKGIKNLQEAHAYISEYEEKWSKYGSILKFLGMKETDLTVPQEEYFQKWLIEYNFQVNIILEACRECINRIKEVNFKYIDAILTNWHKSGVKNADDIKKLTKEPRSQKKANPYVYSGERLYNVNELEKRLLGRSDIDEYEE
jgi:DnaD/phage-associated family protein